MTTVKWTQRHGSKSHRITSGEVIDSAIENAPDYHAGKLEAVVARLNKLQQVVVSLVELLPVEAQRRVVWEHGFNYEESTDA